MGAIPSEYLTDSNAHRWPVTAKAAKLTGSGSKTAYAWVVTDASLPAALIDSDNPDSEASGGPTIVISTDEEGTNRLGVHIEDFTPGSGAAGTAEIWIRADGTYTAGSSYTFYIWWITGGSQTQPARAAQYGADSVYTGIEFISHDGGLTDSSPNAHTQTDTGTADTATTVIGANAREHGAGDSMQTPVDMDDATSGFTWLLWGRRTSSGGNTRYVMAQWQGTTGNTGLIVYSGTDAAGGCTVYRDAGVLMSSASFWTLDTYVHAAVTYDSTNGYELFRNGSSATTNASTTFPDFASQDTALFCGNIASGIRPWIGQIDEPWAIKSTLDSDQVAHLYQNQNDPADFWDSTAAVADGPFSGAANKKGCISLGIRLGL